MQKILRKIYYTAHLALPWLPIKPRPVVIDIVIPVCEKDLHLLPLCLEGVRRNVRHEVAEIYIVAAENPRVRAFCTEYGLIFVEETSVLGYGPRELGVRVGNPPRDRSGWIFQQLLKLSGRIGESEYFLVIDSDHLLLRPHTFVAADGRLVFYGSAEYHEPYYCNIEKLMGYYPRSGMSYVAHKMIFNRRLLVELRAEVERRNGGMRWDKAIVGSLDPRTISGFSEFELFGNFVPTARKRLIPWRQKSLRYDKLADFDTLCRTFSLFYASISFPDYRSAGMAIPDAAALGIKEMPRVEAVSEEVCV